MKERVTSDCIVSEINGKICVKVWCPECDDFAVIFLPFRTKYATSVAKRQHAIEGHDGNMAVYKFSIDRGMSSGEWKHLQEWVDQHPESGLAKLTEGL